MRSPLHPHSFLERTIMEPGIDAFRCPRSGGVWLPGKAYRRWRESLDTPIPDAEGKPGSDDTGEDSPAGKRCPEDGYFLIRHRVGHGLGFHVDRCAACGGVWLDAGEWQALAARHLHDDLHLVFTSAWQAEVRRQDRQAAMDTRMIGWLGEDDYAEVRRIREWIDAHPHAYVLRAFLNGEKDV